MSVPFGRGERRRLSGLRRFTAHQQYLNPWLHRRLSRLFGTVIVAHEGEELIASSVQNILSGRSKLLFQQHGESYRVSCPFCSDTRHRLYISYMYGQRCADGRDLSFLVFCFNEDCLADPDNRWRLRDMLEDRDGALRMAKVSPGRVVETTPGVFEMPGDCTLLSDLAVGHAARVYVSNRQFDPDRLARVWGVSYCRHSHFYFVRDRLVVPIKFNGQLAGWQARHIGELDWKSKKIPKYFTCPGMRRDLVIGNWDMARRYRTLVIVEGWFDVFGFGPMAVNTLGVGMSEQQIRRIVRTYRESGGSVVLLYDGDVYNKPKLSGRVEQLSRRLRRSLPGQFVEVRLPEGCDPGSLNRDVSRAVIVEQAERDGVAVAWSKF